MTGIGDEASRPDPALCSGTPGSKDLRNVGKYSDSARAQLGIHGCVVKSCFTSANK